MALKQEGLTHDRACLERFKFVFIQAEAFLQHLTGVFREARRRTLIRRRSLRQSHGIGDHRRVANAGQGQGQGKTARDNPFTEGSSLWADWQLGWRLVKNLSAVNENRHIAGKAVEASACELGQAAAARGAYALANPYHFGHPGHEQWRLGWAAAKSS